eukprot:Skav236350  [mRNA]  locus=scaffold918:159923:162142:+ [translate_table: standard]
MSCWFCSFALISLAVADPQGEVPEALQYLGKGYNIIIGDPHSTDDDRDPGWSGTIIERSWLKDEWITDDARCSYEASNTQITGAKSAQESRLKEWNVKASVGLFKIVQAAFTASGSVQEMDQKSFKFKETFFETRASCHLKTAELPAPFVRYNFSAEFQAAVAQIPTDGTYDPVQWVMENILASGFGTHYTSKIASGGLMGIRSWMSESSFDSLEKTATEKGFSLDLAAKSFFWLFSDPSGSGGFKQNEDATKAFQEAMQSGGTSSFCTGCAQFVKDDAGKWAEQVQNNLVPIGSKSNELVPISELLVPIHFPDLDAELLKKKKATVEQALEKLCDYYAKEGCTTTPRDHIEIPPRTILIGSEVNSVQWSPDGATLVTGAEDGLVRLWEAATGRGIRALTGHTDMVMSVSFSPDGSRIASGSYDESVKIWDAASGECVHTLTGHTSYVWSVSFSPDGSRIASGSYDKSVKIWDAASGECVHTLTGHTSYVWSVSFSPDGSRIASGSSGSNSVKIWDAASGECVHTLTEDPDTFAVSFSPDGSRIASGSSGSNSVKIWDAASGECVHTLTEDPDTFAVSFSPDGSRIASGNFESVKIWDAAAGECLLTLTGHTSFVESVSFSPDGSRIASGSYDMSVKIWDAASGECVHTLTGHTDEVLSVSFSPDGSRIASGSKDKSVKIWDAASGEWVFTLTEHTDMFDSAYFSADGSRIAGRSQDHAVNILDAAAGQHQLKSAEFVL